MRIKQEVSDGWQNWMLGGGAYAAIAWNPESAEGSSLVVFGECAGGY